MSSANHTGSVDPVNHNGSENANSSSDSNSTLPGDDSEQQPDEDGETNEDDQIDYDAGFYLAYQSTINTDYMTYDTYAFYRPPDEIYNQTSTTEFDPSLKCGECIGGGFVYCTHGSRFGQILNDNQEPEFGYCCQDAKNCSEAYESNDMVCSSNYTDPYMSYQICPVHLANCSDPYILASAVSLYSYRNVRSLQAGETCNYRMKSTCGAPTFEASAGGTWSSTLTDFNITWNEFEEK